MTLDRFDGAAGGIGLRFVIATDEPDHALVFDSNHARTQNVPGGMEGKFDAVMVHGFTVVQSLDVDFGTKAVLKNGDAIVRSQIVRGAGSSMVAVCMGNDGTIHSAPRVDIEIADGTIEATVCQFD